MNVMKSWYSEATIIENKELPYDYGIIMAKKTIYKVFSRLPRKEFNQKFIDSILERENQKSHEIDDLNQLFK